MLVVYCVQAELAFATAAVRDAVLADITARIGSRPRWRETTAQATALDIGAHGIVVETRFTSKADQADLLARVEAFATGARQPLPGSSLRLHDCPHDGGGVPCSGVTARTW